MVTPITKPKIIKKRPPLATIDEEEKPAKKTRTVKPKAVVRLKRKEVPSDDEFELENDSSAKPAPSKKLKASPFFRYFLSFVIKKRYKAIQMCSSRSLFAEAEMH